MGTPLVLSNGCLNVRRRGRLERYSSLFRRGVEREGVGGGGLEPYMGTQRRVLFLLPLALALQPALPIPYPHTPSSFYFALPARLSVPGCNLESVSRAGVSTDCTISVWVGLPFGSSLLREPCFEAPALPCPHPCPPQHPSFPTYVQCCVSMEGLPPFCLGLC